MFNTTKGISIFNRSYRYSLQFWLCVCSCISARAQNIVSCEYFFDTDPGVGNGTDIEFAPSNEVVLNTDISIDSLTPGLHSFFLRWEDDEGRWSLADRRLFMVYGIENTVQRQIVAAECFFDQDPGIGNGTEVGITQRDLVTIAGDLELSELISGLHSFYLRLMDESRNWSLADCRLFLINEAEADQYLTAAEYFINEDPGVGMGIPFSLPEDGFWNDNIEIVSTLVQNVPWGRHWAGIRFRNNYGAWSLAKADSFLVGPELHIQPGALPTVLSWEGDIEGDMIYVYRASSFDGPYALIDSTDAAGYVDLDSMPDNGPKLYRITQSMDSRLTYFRMPYYDENGRLVDFPRKARFVPGDRCATKGTSSTIGAQGR